jgi:UDP-N-acetylmuramyl pentapeptide phosphotransferase/UDP-N-acetylglucosamine-1-phosphate transferase
VSIVYLAIAVLSAIATCALIALSQPLLRSYALARPNARSSHKVPTPQGGGIFVVLVTLAAGILAAGLPGPANASLAWTLAATLALAGIGAADDLLTLPAGPRLALQAIAVFAVAIALPPELRVVPALPWWLERALIVFAGIWFVNLVNFMDGIDWITVAEVVPVSAGLALFGVMGALPPAATALAFALAGAMIGFAPFNRPVARLFLGDVGSLPIGLMLGYLLTLLAGDGHLAAALLLPLYYLADATITLLRRAARGEALMQAHRSHFYQQALDTGLGIYRIVGGVFALNVALIALAGVTFVTRSPAWRWAAVLTGCALVVLLLRYFARAKR